MITKTKIRVTVKCREWMFMKVKGVNGRALFTFTLYALIFRASCQETISNKCQNMFSRKNKENILKCQFCISCN